MIDYQQEEFILDMPENSLNLNIPYAFFIEHTSLNWNEFYFGLKSQYVSLNYAIEKAVSDVSLNNSTSNTLLELASLFKNEEDLAKKYINDLIEEKIIDPILLENKKFMIDCKNKYLYIALLWLFQDPKKYNHPKGFELREMAYNAKVYNVIWDFKIPSIPARDFRYFSMTFEVTEKNQELYLNRWKQFLEEQKQIVE
ncbi:DUF2247 family protein [Rummeliibacillus stabekisii]|uniref:DUF2247 family protein n=1 Tax=Rummeliibacillus stabekisii TaxID=241244 RepID=UPI001608E95F|nr:DUF2247 family protein [Rummeliibacillus stabekisii]MBB5171545.1 hypothetical protein [Rummeliibacillus stabekisii]